MKIYLTVEEAAGQLQLHPHTVRRILSAGGLPGRKIGKVWRIPADELAEFMATREAVLEKQAAEDEIEAFMAEQRLLLPAL